MSNPTSKFFIGKDSIVCTRVCISRIHRDWKENLSTPWTGDAKRVAYTSNSPQLVEKRDPLPIMDIFVNNIFLLTASLAAFPALPLERLRSGWLWVGRAWAHRRTRRRRRSPRSPRTSQPPPGSGWPVLSWELALDSSPDPYNNTIRLKNKICNSKLGRHFPSERQYY